MIENRDRIKSGLVLSKKVRISDTRLKELLDSDSGTNPTDLLVLLTDAGEFRTKVADHPLFKDVRQRISDFSLCDPVAPSLEEIVIFKDELPGPMAMVNIGWDLVVELIAWDCVRQVEENKVSDIR